MQLVLQGVNKRGGSYTNRYFTAGIHGSAHPEGDRTATLCRLFHLKPAALFGPYMYVKDPIDRSLQDPTYRDLTRVMEITLRST